MGARVLMHYDIVGVARRDPAISLHILEAASPQAAQIVREAGPRVFSYERVEAFDRSPELSKALWRTPADAVRRQWLSLLAHEPRAYLAHRAQAFWWVAATPELDRCLPVFTGVADVPAKLQALEIVAGQRPQDRTLAQYAAAFFDTPLYSHLTYAALALALAGFLAWRGEAADMVVAAMLLSALGFAASFFLISVACDYRYLYYLDVASLAGLLYVALDPSLNRRRRRAG